MENTWYRRARSAARWTAANGNGALAGALYGLSSPVYGWSWLLWVYFIPLLFAAQDPRRARSWLAWQGVAFAVVAGQVLMYWVAPAFGTLWSLPTWQILPFAMGMLFINDLSMALMPWLARLSRSGLWLLLGFPVSAAALDYIYPKFLPHVPAHWLLFHPGALSHFAFPYGAIPLSALVLAVNAGVYLLLRRKLAWWAAGVIVAVVAAINLVPPKDVPRRTRTLAVSTVNTDLPVHYYLSPEAARARHGIVLQLLREAPAETLGRLLVLPEIIYPHDLASAEGEELLRLVRERGLSVIMGGVKTVEGGVANVMYFLRPAGETTEVQWIAKRLLFPFGETLPFSETLPFLRHFFPGPFLSVPPGGQQFFEHRGVRIGTAICYESIFPEFLRGRPQVDLVLNPVSEAFFPAPGQPELSFALSVFFSLENAVTMLRVTNAGSYGLVERGQVREFAFAGGDPKWRHYDLDL